MKKSLLSLFLLAAALGASMPVRAEFSQSATLIVSGYSGPALANFPVLVRISADRISGFDYEDVQSATGADIAFFVDDVQCPHEIDTWDTSGESLVWVRLPSLYPNCRVTMRWGDASVTEHPSSRNLWSAVGSSDHYVGVWHFRETITSTTASTAASADSALWDGSISMDATPKPYSDNATYSKEMISEDGIIGLSRRNYTSNQRFKTGLSIAASTTVTLGTTFTLSGWFNASDMTSNDFTFFARRTYFGEGGAFYVKRTSKGKLEMVAGSETYGGLEATAPNFLNNWVHVAFVYDGSTRIIYTNGVELARKTGLALPTDTNKRIAFGAASTGQDYAFSGRYDEIRIFGSAASGDWIAAEYQTVVNEDFITEYVAGQQDVTLITEPSGAGSFEVNGVPVAAGTVGVSDSNAVVFAAVPASGYEFLRWEGADVLPQNATSPSITLPVFATRTLTAIFYPVATSHVAADVVWSSGAASFGPGDRVTVPEGATVVLSEPTPHLASFDVFGTVVVSNWFSRILADAITVHSGGVVQAGNDWPMLNGGVSNRVYLAGASLVVEPNGIISANGAGYAGTNGPCWTASVTRKSVSSNVNISPYGGAYGGTPGYDGRADLGTTWGTPPEPYGSTEWPFDPGSGGGGFVRSGGGAIFLDFTGNVVISGEVKANASGKSFRGYPAWESNRTDSWGYHNSSYGSGGGIVIKCRTISGSGTVCANSCHITSEATGYGGGSGGRIAVHYNAASQSNTVCGVRFETMRGISHGSKDVYLRGPYAGGPGTLWFTDNSFLSSYAATGWKFGGEWHSGVALPNPLAIDGDLTVDGALLRFTEENLAFDVAGDLVLTGTLHHAKLCGLSFAAKVSFAVGGSVRIVDSMLEFGGGGTAAVAGDFRMSDSETRRKAAVLVLQAAQTNSDSNVSMDFSVGGKWSLGRYTICLAACDPDVGSAPVMSADSLFVDDDAEINASGLGFGAQRGPGYASSKIGSSHGGMGGSKTALTPKPVYDDETNPLLPGSGELAKCFGGGVVNLTVSRTAEIRGKILADSLNKVILNDPGYILGSSGGSINLRAYKLTGGENSLLSALGGCSWNTTTNRSYYNDVGVGGGGRIAIRAAINRTDWRDNPARVSAKTYSAANGSLSVIPTDGTIWWGDLPLHGYMIMVK